MLPLRRVPTRSGSHAVTAPYAQAALWKPPARCERAPPGAGSDVAAATIRGCGCHRHRRPGPKPAHSAPRGPEVGTVPRPAPCLQRWPYGLRTLELRVDYEETGAGNPADASYGRVVSRRRPRMPHAAHRAVARRVAPLAAPHTSGYTPMREWRCLSSATLPADTHAQPGARGERRTALAAVFTFACRPTAVAMPESFHCSYWLSKSASSC